MRYVVVVYEFEDGPMKQVATHQEDAMTPDDAVEQWAAKIEEVRQS